MTEDIDTFKRKKMFGLRDRGKRKDMTWMGFGGGDPVGGDANPGRSIADIYDMHYINNDEIPPQHDLNKYDNFRILRKKKKGKIKQKRKINKCKCKK